MYSTPLKAFQIHTPSWHNPLLSHIALTRAMAAFLAARLSGRNPTNWKPWVGSPEAHSAATAAQAPGMGMTLCPAAAAAATKTAPGSLMAGTPASLTSASGCR